MEKSISEYSRDELIDIICKHCKYNISEYEKQEVNVINNTLSIVRTNSGTLKDGNYWHDTLSFHVKLNQIPLNFISVDYAFDNGVELQTIGSKVKVENSKQGSISSGFSEGTNDHVTVYTDNPEKLVPIFQELVRKSGSNAVSQLVGVRSGGEGCFIATAVYGSSTESDVLFLKEFRDIFLLKFSLGKKFVKFYYWFSPSFANYLKGRTLLSSFVKLFVIRPIVKVLRKTKRLWAK